MPDPMKSPVTTFLYVLMRDHLPTGTVKFLIEQAQRAGDPAYSAPELEQLAERYAAELLGAPPRKLDADDEEELPTAPVGLPGSGDQAERHTVGAPAPPGEGAVGGAAPGRDGIEPPPDAGRGGGIAATTAHE